MFIAPDFFIVGVGRSGTTLLMSMLNAHPQIIVPPEFEYVHRILGSNVFRTKSIDELFQILFTDELFLRLDISKSELAEPFVQKGISYSPVRVYEHMLWICARRAEKIVVGDKDPRAIDELPIIKSLFPKTRILHIVRDPRDVFLSRTKAEWTRSRPDFMNILAYVNQYSKAKQWGKQLFGNAYMEFRYEDLIAEPEVTLSRVCTFLDVPYDSHVLAFQGSSGKLVSKSETQWHGNLSKPLMSNNLNKWQRDLTRGQLLLVEASCDHAMSTHGYELSGIQPGYLEAVQIHLWRACLNMVSKLYDQRIRWKNRHAITELDFG
jgi:LPS sulfotransferase NodH